MIWKNKDDIKRQGIQTAKFDAKTIVWKKSTAKLEIEQLLLIWVEDCAKFVENNANSFQIFISSDRLIGIDE